MKETWKIVNEIVNKTSKITKIDLIKVNDQKLTDKIVIHGLMNTYVCIVRKNLKFEIPYETKARLHVTG